MKVERRNFVETLSHTHLFVFSSLVKSPVMILAIAVHKCNYLYRYNLHWFHWYFHDDVQFNELRIFNMKFPDCAAFTWFYYVKFKTVLCNQVSGRAMPWILVVLSCLFYGFVHVVRICGFVSSVSRYRKVVKGNRNAVSIQPDLEFDHGEHEGVTILRPLKGKDAELYGCLKSSFIQSYRKVQILMCCVDEDDPAVEVANKVLSEFPEQDAELLLGLDYAYGVNPKVCNLVKGYKHAKYDNIWILDANIKMHKNALSRSIGLLKNNIEIVHHLPVCVAGPTAGWGGLLDDIYMGTVHSLFYAGINAFAIAPCIMGKSNIFKRSSLDGSVKAEHGMGLQNFAKYLAEDNMMAEALWAQGGRTVLAPDVAIQPLDSSTKIREYWLRRIRWIRLRKYMVVSATLVEPFTDCFFSTAFVCLFASLGLTGFVFLTIIWFICDFINYNLMFRKAQAPVKPFFKFALVWFLRETSAFPLWIIAMWGKRVFWRNKEYRIRSDLAAEEI